MTHETRRTQGPTGGCGKRCDFHRQFLKMIRIEPDNHACRETHQPPPQFYPQYTPMVQPMPSKLPKLFWGLSNEQRRILSTRMLEAGHSGYDLEKAIRLAVWGEGSLQRGQVSPRGVVSKAIVFNAVLLLLCELRLLSPSSSHMVLMLLSVVFGS